MSEQQEHVHVPEPRPQRRGGRVRGAEGYHREDILALLRCVRDAVPTTPEEWDQVLDEYRTTHATPHKRSQRDANALRVKFKQLARGFKPGVVGRPEVQEAGAIVDLIDAKIADGKWIQRRGGRTKGAEGFSTADSEAILSIVRQVQPVYRADWERAAEQYCREYAVPNGRMNRDGVSIKNKFRNMLKDGGGAMPQIQAAEALAVHVEIEAKIRQLASEAASGELRTDAGVDVDNGEVGKEREVEAVVTEAADGHDQSATSSEGGDQTAASEPRYGGRALGSEGYSQSDIKALLACVKEVVPWGPTSWEQVLQLYRMNHTIPNSRAPRNAAGIKIKFRQLVNMRHAIGKVAPEEVLEARSIQQEIDLRTQLGKHPRPDSGADSRTPDEQPVQVLAYTEPRNNENLGRQNVTPDAGNSAASPQTSNAEPVAKRPKQDSNIVSVPKEVENQALQSEIASRELELLRQREEREAEQAAWEKERTLREKQRMDIEAWTFVCDRLRALYREQATETNPEIVNEIKEEIAVLKKKKQRLATLMM